LGLFCGRILAMLEDAKSRVPTDPSGSRFFRRLLRLHLACLECRGTQKGRNQMHTSKLSPDPKIRIMTILHEFRDSPARAFGSFPLRDNDEVLKITSEAFKLLNEENLAGAIPELLSMKGVGISIASKIIGLLNQNWLAIYDSPVGTALRTLKHERIRIIRCPPGRTRPGDFCTYKQWAENYPKLIWVLEFVRDTLE